MTKKNWFPLAVAFSLLVGLAVSPITSNSVPPTRLVAGKSLSSDVTIASTDLTDSANLITTSAGYTYLNAPLGQIFTVTVTGINLKTVAVTDIFTVPSGKTFVLTNGNVVVTAASSVTNGGTFQLRESGASGPMTWPTNTTTTAVMTSVGVSYNFLLGGVTLATNGWVVCTTGNKVQYNQSTGATATTLTGDVAVIGYYK